MAAAAYSDVNLGEQINALADGMSVLKQNGIGVDDARNVAEMIDTIGSAIGRLKFDDAGIDNMRSLAVALRLLGQVTPEVSDNIAYLSRTLMPERAARLTDFFKKLDITNQDSVKSAIEAVSMFSHLSDDTIDKINRLGDLDPNVAKTLSEFIHSLDLSAIKALGEE